MNIKIAVNAITTTRRVFSATALLLASGWGPWAQEEALFSYEPELDTTMRRAAA